MNQKGIGSGELAKLVTGDPVLEIKDLCAGYGKMEILHQLNLLVGKGQSLCLIGPNGAGKSTVLQSIFGFTNIRSGKILAKQKDIGHISPADKLRKVGIAYILQDNSVFPNMSVEENLYLGGFTSKKTKKEIWNKVEEVFERTPRLASRRKKNAKVLSGGERRLLEISRALILDPQILLVDEPSIGLEPRYIAMVFDILKKLQQEQQKTIILVEQNAKKGLEFADIGYVLVSGEVVMAASGKQLLQNPEIGKLFLGG